MRKIPGAALVAVAFFFFPMDGMGQELSALQAPGGNLAAAAAVGGAPGGVEEEAPFAARQDFLFSQPRFSLTLRGGMFFNRGDSELHDFVTDHLTLERSDFDTGLGGIEAGLRLGERMEIVVGSEWGQTTLPSELEHWTEEDGRPILQSTRLRHGPSFLVGLKAYAFPRGEAISTYAWTPRRANVFVGAGYGAVGYEFEQWGDFVNEQTEMIVAVDIRSSGRALGMYAGSGIEIALSNRVSLIGEGRYLWARTELDRNFDFLEIDLSGLRLTAGLGFRL